MENPEVVGAGGIFLAVLTAWFKMRPAMRKLELKDDTSLRGDLLKRITQLEADQKAEQRAHTEMLLAMKAEHAKALVEMTAKHEEICRDYETKLSQLQSRFDGVMDRLLEQLARNTQ